MSRVLAEYERRHQVLLPFVAVAFALHAAVVVAAFVAGRAPSSRPAQLPVVSVRLIRPQPQAPARRSRRAATAPAPRVAERPTPPPEPRPSPALPKPEAKQPPSANAMPAARSSATPAPRADATSGDDAASSGLSVRSGGGTPGIPADFQFTYYVDRMLALIESRWYKPPVTGSPRARVRFTIHRSGHVDGIVLEESSGVPSFDRAALRALYGVNPLPPLPPAYGKTTLTVHLTFSE